MPLKLLNSTCLKHSCSEILTFTKLCHNTLLLSKLNSCSALTNANINILLQMLDKMKIFHIPGFKMYCNK